MLKTRKQKISDEDLVRTIVEDKNHEEFGILYDRYSEKVYHKCISFVKDIDLARDLTHDIFLKTFINLSKFNHQSRFSTWLYSLTYNFCIDYIRKNSKMKRESQDSIADIPDEDDAKNETEMLQFEAKKLTSVLDALEVKEKAILLMKYQDDMSIKDIAIALAASESAVKMRIKRSKAKAVELHKTMFGNG